MAHQVGFFHPTPLQILPPQTANVQDPSRNIRVFAALQKKPCCKSLLLLFATVSTVVVLAFRLLAGPGSLAHVPSGSDTFSPHNSLVFPVNGLYCDQFSISKYQFSPASLWNTSLYILNERPSQTDRYNFTVSKGGVGDFLRLEPGEYYQWSFNLLNGSQYSVSACAWLSSGVTLRVLTKSEWSAAGHVLPPCNTTGRPGVLITAEKVLNNDKYYFVYKSISAETTSVWIQMNFSSLDYAIGTNTSNIFASCSCLYSNYSCSQSLPMNFFNGFAVVKTFAPEDASWEEQLYVTWVCEASYNAYLLLFCLPIGFVVSCLLLLSCVHELCSKTPEDSTHQPHRISRSNARLLFAMGRVIFILNLIFVMSMLVLLIIQFLQYFLKFISFGNPYVTLAVLSMAIGVLCCSVSCKILLTCSMNKMIRVAIQPANVTGAAPGQVDPTSNCPSQAHYIPVATTEHQADTTEHQDDTTEHQDDTAEHQADTAEHQADITEHQADTTEHQDDITEHQDDITEHQADTTEHQADTAEHQADTAEHQADTTEHQADTTEHQDDTAEHQADTAEHQADITEHQADTTEHQDDITEHQDDITEHQADTTEHQADTTEHQDDITEHHDDTTELIARKNEMRALHKCTMIFSIGSWCVIAAIIGVGSFTLLEAILPFLMYSNSLAFNKTLMPGDTSNFSFNSFFCGSYTIEGHGSSRLSATLSVSNLSLVEYSPYYENGTLIKQCSISPHTVDTCTVPAPGIGDMTWLVSVSYDPLDSAKLKWDESLTIKGTCNLRADTWTVLWMPVLLINSFIIVTVLCLIAKLRWKSLIRQESQSTQPASTERSEAEEVQHLLRNNSETTNTESNRSAGIQSEQNTPETSADIKVHSNFNIQYDNSPLPIKDDMALPVESLVTATVYSQTKDTPAADETTAGAAVPRYKENHRS